MVFGKLSRSAGPLLTAISAFVLLSGCQPSVSAIGANAGVRLAEQAAASSNFDVEPDLSIVSRVPTIQTIRPMTVYAARMSANLPPAEAERSCNWVTSEGFPRPQPALIGYDSYEQMAGSGNHMPNEGNEVFSRGGFYAQRASSAIVGGSSSGVERIFANALLSNAEARAGLDLSRFLIAGRNRPAALADGATAVEVGTAWTIAYLLTKDQLPLTDAERVVVENWLGEMLTTYVDGYRRWAGSPDLRSEWLIAWGDMVQAIFEEDAAAFNRAARNGVRTLAYVREDGSHRFGASRGFRAVFYQGVVITNAVDTMLLMESQGIEARRFMLPIIERMTRFWADAYDDPSLIHPYARENVAGATGSDWRVQDRLEVLWSIDTIIALTEDADLRSDLQRIRRDAPYPTLYSAAWNEACFAAALN